MRKRSHARRALLGTCLILASGCATEDLRPDYDGARALITATTGRADVYDPETAPLSDEEIGDFLAEGLSLDEALRLALLNSRRLQADFMRLGIARADYVQAGLLENPTLGLWFLFPSGGDRTRVAADVAQSIMEIWRLPERRQAAAAGMEQQVLKLARQAGELVGDIKATYFESVAAREARLAAEAGADLAHRSLEAVQTRVASGVATEIEANLVQSEALAADLEARRAERREAVTTRRLASLLSLTTDLAGVPLTDALPAPQPALADRETFVEHGRASRLDLRALAAAVAAAEARVALERKRAAPDVTAGVFFERPESPQPTDHVLGPSVSVELPIFDRNEAGISRAEFELEQLRKDYEALSAEVGQLIRAAVDRAGLASDASIFVQGQLLPQAERSVGLAREAFDLGDTTVLPLLAAQRAVVQAREDGIDAALKAALALVDLERALGGPLPSDVGSP